MLVVVGRRRTTCSDACRRALQSAMRKVERRERWIELWLRERGARPEAEIRANIAELHADIRELLRALGRREP